MIIHAYSDVFRAAVHRSQLMRVDNFFLNTFFMCRFIKPILVFR